jgi:hypothetical protein
VLSVKSERGRKRNNCWIIIRHVVWYFTDISEWNTAAGFTVEGLARQATRRVMTAKYQTSWRLLLADYLLCFNPEDGGGASETSVNFYLITRRYMSAASVLDCGSFFCVISNNLKLSYIHPKFRPVLNTQTKMNISKSWCSGMWLENNHCVTRD